MDAKHAVPIKIAIAGRFRTGKDTVADIIEAHLTMQSGPGTVARLGFADALKYELSTMVANFTLPDDLFVEEGSQMYALPSAYEQHEELMAQRRAVNGVGWQWWGEYRRRFYGEDYWINHSLFRARLEDAAYASKHIIIRDMRHHNEAQWTKQNGFYLIRVEGPRRSEDARAPDHPSERYVDELPVHCTIHNNGSLYELGELVERLLKYSIAAFFAR